MNVTVLLLGEKKCCVKFSGFRNCAVEIFVLLGNCALSLSVCLPASNWTYGIWRWGYFVARQQKPSDGEWYRRRTIMMLYKLIYCLKVRSAQCCQPCISHFRFLLYALGHQLLHNSLTMEINHVKQISVYTWI